MQYCVKFQLMETKPQQFGRGRLGALLVAAILVGIASCAKAQSDGDDSAAPETRTVLITGANRGIGLELARQYATGGWQVIGTARRPDDAKALRDTGADVVQLDVTDQQSVDRLADNLEGRAIDLLINNAGILPLMWTLEEVDIEQFNRILAVNTVGPVRVTKALLPNLRTGELKTVVNVTSNLGSIGEGFTCIVMHPGWVKTDMGGTSAPVEVEDSAAGIRRVIDSLTPNDNGTFWTFEGDQMAW